MLLRATDTTWVPYRAEHGLAGTVGCTIHHRHGDVLQSGQVDRDVHLGPEEIAAASVDDFSDRMFRS